MKTLLLCMVLLYPWPPLFADWNEAMAAYDRSEFQQAYALFADLRTETATSASLEYNLGNSAFRMGQPDLALAHYRRALWLSPGDPDLRTNLNQALDATGAEWPPLPLSRRISAPLTHTAWTRLWFAFLTLTALYGILTRIFSMLRDARAWVYPLAFTLLITAGWGYWASSPQRMQNEAVLVGEDIIARFEPVESSTRHFSLPGGSVVRIQEHTRQWVRVRSSEASGWVHRDKLIPMR